MCLACVVMAYIGMPWREPIPVSRHVYVFGNVYRRMGLRVDLCLAITNLRVDLCLAITNMRVDLCLAIANMRVDLCLDMRVDACRDMCTDVLEVPRLGGSVP